METGEIISTIVNEFPYALYGSMLVGALCAFLGVYIVAKRVVFLGAALTQISVLGLALTFLPFLAIPHTIGSLIITIAAVILLSRLLTGRDIPKDATLGVVFVFAIAARILVMQKTPKIEVSEIENLLRGDILFVTPELFYWLVGVFIVTMAIHLLFFKEFTYISFDAETASTQGYRVKLWEMAFYVIAAVVISVATHIVGDVFVFGFLVVPPVAAMLLARNVRNIFAVAVLIGLLSPVVGLFLAFKLDFPSSPTIVAVASLVLLFAWFSRVAKRR
ncbi:MAG: metal ABC transporter permease [Ignavibacteriae bacterium]|nr:metal ABC transporter permease [Ignavibacteriota bacterium]